MISNWYHFLIVQHLKTFFAPWHRQNPSDIRKKNRTFSDRIVGGIIDLYIRIIAAFVRLVVIIIGLITYLATAVVFVLLFIIWFVWPILSLLLIIRGLLIIF